MDDTLGQLLNILKVEPEDKNLITLRQLLQYLNCDEEKIQISYNLDWDVFDEFWAGSPLLVPYLDKEIIELGAIGKDVIRITIK